MYDLFSELFDDFGFVSAIPVQHEEKRCPLCGHSYSDFKRSGKLGCSKCYKVFKNALIPTLKQIHQNPFHTGKVPASFDEQINKKRKLEDLKNQLSEAVKAEDYEQAAKLHSQIKEIERGDNK